MELLILLNWANVKELENTSAYDEYYIKMGKFEYNKCDFRINYWDKSPCNTIYRHLIVLSS